MQRDLKRAVAVLLAAKSTRKIFVDFGIGTPEDCDFCDAVDTVIEFITDSLKFMGGFLNANND